MGFSSNTEIYLLFRDARDIKVEWKRDNGQGQARPSIRQAQNQTRREVQGDRRGEGNDDNNDTLVEAKREKRVIDSKTYDNVKKESCEIAQLSRESALSSPFL